VPKRIIPLAVIAVLALALLGYWVFGRHHDDSHLVLQGNVDLRQIELPFNDSERIAEVLVDEGTTVKAGQVLARLDTGRLLPRVAQAEARAAAQREALRKLQNGARPEEISQARAAVAAAQAEAVNASSQLQRLRSISDESKGRAISPQDLEAATAAARSSEAQAESSRKGLELTLAGPRREEIDQAKAQLDAAEADLALLKRQLADAELIAPTDGVIRNRLMEPGELATPQRPVFAIAITTPKWVRAYLSEVELSRVALGAPARITMDSAPNDPMEGKVGFISSTAEFTPKTVQTEELRTSLVYEVRVFVDDPQDRLRLGMPATVTITPTERQASSRESGK
jgi:HlyD family secretion protein